MKTHSCQDLLGSSSTTRWAVTVLLSLFLLSFLLCAAPGGKTFPTPQELVNTLGQAVNTTNRNALALLLGPESEYLVNPDPVLGEAEFADFGAAFNATNRLVSQSDTRMILQVGPNAWPFPIPLVRTASGWSFDTAAGREEILNRRIGKNELEVLQAMRAYVDAQREYASRDRDGDGVLEYAQKIASSPGQTDGLYWPSELNGELSPLGPLYAESQLEGYFHNDSSSAGPRPFHGYYFKLLKAQGKHAPGGKYKYVINGNMIGGFALIAWPAEYRESGVMTFVVNQQGRVYQKDLGAATEKAAPKMSDYDPDPSWRLSPD
jgi:hypothetical protein